GIQIFLGTHYGVFITTYVPSGGYYLIVGFPGENGNITPALNFSTFMVSGQWIQADAIFDPSTFGTPGGCANAHAANSTCYAIPPFNYGGVRISSAGILMDQVCWNGAGGPPHTPTDAAQSVSNDPGGSPPNDLCSVVNPATTPPNYAYVPLNANCGMNTGYTGANTGCGTACQCPGTAGTPAWLGNQLVRYSSPTFMNFTSSMTTYPSPPADTIRGLYGSAYNSRNNSADFMYPSVGAISVNYVGINYPPFNNAPSATPNPTN